MPKESAKTSLNQIASVFKQYEVGPRNLDIGGGKYDTATKYLKKHGIKNLVFDLYNRTYEHNEKVLTDLTETGVDSITVLNVLNVIKCKNERRELLHFINAICTMVPIKTGKYPVVIFKMYEKNGDGKEDGTCQTNMKTEQYIPEIQEAFPDWEVQKFGNVVVV